MSPRTVRSARKELRALVAGALAGEDGLSEAATRRIVNRILRQSGRIAEIAGALRAAETPPRAAEAVRPVLVTVEPCETFDPYAIGAVVTLQRHGADALRERLAAITRVEDLCSLAAAQHLAVPAAWSSAEELRAAIVESAAQRLAERRAAAS